MNEINSNNNVNGNYPNNNMNGNYPNNNMNGNYPNNNMNGNYPNNNVNGNYPNNNQSNGQNSTYVYAGFWIRFLAVFLDGLIIGAPLGVLFWFVSKSSGIESLSYISTILYIGYIIYFEGTKGYTLGKYIVGIKIINYQGEVIGIGNAALRFVGKILSGVILLIGYIMAAFDSKKQALHDRIASTYVVYK